VPRDLDREIMNEMGALGLLGSTIEGYGCADHARGLSIAWVANDAPPAWLQPALGREPERLVAPPAADPTVDPTGTYRVPEVGDVAVQRDRERLRVQWRGVTYQAFAVARGVHNVPGLDATLRFSAAPDGSVTMALDSVYVVAPAVARRGP
jgi:hypothetical protein